MMDIWSNIVPFAFLVLIECLVVRWVAGGPVPGLVSRIFATNLTGVALLMFISLTGWFFGWWPDIRNWALRDSFFLFLVIKAPIFWFLFRRWGTQRIFTLHVISNFASIIVLSLLFVYAPMVIAIKPITVYELEMRARTRLHEIRDALELYKVTHGYYPEYIWGGDMMSWGSGGSPDPLLSEGYLPHYPINPLNLRRTFFEPRRDPGFWQLWFGHKSVSFLHVRNLWQPIVESDPRFGYRGAKMGNVLPDPDIPESSLPGDVRFTINSKWFPGGFFYRSYDLDEDGKPDAYILGLCGYENAQASMDCYDARLDSLTQVITVPYGDEMKQQIVPSAQDSYRDGVITRLHRGFPTTPRTVKTETDDLDMDTETTGEVPQPEQTDDNLSAGMSESVVTPEEINSVNDI